MLSDNDIDDFLRNDDDFLDALAFSPFGGFWRSHHDFLYLGRTQSDWQFKVEAFLSVDGNRICEVVFHHITFDELRELLHHHAVVMSHLMPEFFCDMWSIRRNHNRQWFKNFAFVTF